jgi:hypothetical protein
MAVATTMANSFIEVSKFGNPIILVETTGSTAAGDQTITFDRPFSVAPKVLSIAITGNATSQTAGDYPTCTVKATTTTTLVLSWGGIFNSKTFGANVLVSGPI